MPLARKLHFNRKKIMKIVKVVAVVAANILGKGTVKDLCVKAVP